MHRRSFLKTGGSLAFGFFGVYCSLSQSRAADSAVDDFLIRNLDRVTTNLMTETKVPGVAIALVRDGNLFWSGGFGIKSTDGENTGDADTIFEAASVSKTIFAYAILKLCDQGKLDLDRPLTKYVPWRFLENDPRLDQITARHILSHSAEHVAGNSSAPRDDQQHLSGNRTPVQKMAHGHDGRLKAKPPARARGSDVARYGSAGGLLTTANDYAKFIIEIVNPEPEPKNAEKTRNNFRLSAARRAEMFKPQIKLPADQLIDGATSWALGWAVQERDDGHYLVHSGGQSGFRFLAMWPLPKTAPASSSSPTATMAANSSTTRSCTDCLIAFLPLLEPALSDSPNPR